MSTESMTEIGRDITDEYINFFFLGNAPRSVYMVQEYRPTTQIIASYWLSEDDSACAIDWYQRNPCPNIPR